MTRDISRWKIRRRSKYEAPHWIFERPIRIDRSRYWHFSTNLEAPKQSAAGRPFDTKHVGAVNRNPGQTEKWSSAPGASGPDPGQCLCPPLLPVNQANVSSFFQYQPTNQIPYQASLYDPLSYGIARLYTRAYHPSPTSDRWNRFLLFRYAEDLSFRKVALINESRNLGLLETLLNIEKYNDRLVGFFFISLSF